MLRLEVRVAIRTSNACVTTLISKPLLIHAFNKAVLLKFKLRRRSRNRSVAAKRGDFYKAYSSSTPV
ncbi:hypothetical protein VKT23_008468 [Stygiomarasmius scandens]|uniref:Uncharacterized protein n=1 Tax=Marasmiellus scandens TaxID=2682957 RepID=A0ABR1JMM3_9AGAR